jgi:hypothetical protein
MNVPLGQRWCDVQELLLAVGPPVSRDGAREEARRELSKSIYGDAEPGWFVRAAEWVDDKIVRFFDWLTPDPSQSGLGGFTGLGALALVIALLAVLVATRMWLGPLRRSARAKERDAVGLDSTLPSEALRELAEADASRGAYAEAVRARLRAIVRMLEEKGVLDPRPGRTAGEIVAEVARATPEAAEPLGEAVTVFSEIWYGGQTATAASYAALARADSALAGLRRPGRAAAEDRSFVVPV